MISDRDTFIYRNGRLSRAKVEVVEEASVALSVNGETWLTFMCTPAQLEALAIGFLYNEGVIQSMQEVSDVRLCEHGDNVDVWLVRSVQQPTHWRRTSGCTGGVTAAANAPPSPAVATQEQLSSDEPDNRLFMSPEQVENLMQLLIGAQELHRTTGGVHTSALSDGKRILVSMEDIGRHNTLDKIAGFCLMQNTWPQKRVLLTTGRISSEMLQKALRLGASVLISRTSPSSLSVQMAQHWGLTLIGYARRGRFTVYAHPERIAYTKTMKSEQAHA